ncbi:MAG: phosphate signaling complex protein PhoU [Leptospirillum sp.]|nr:phosphate signaling complex protein PhoU [Nitrospiraceae bacterium]
MHRHFDAELDELKEKVSAMGRMVEEQLEGAIASLVGRDADKAGEIIAKDHQVNAMEVGIDEDCIRMIALYQPEARDLRFIITAMKIITDLERMSDLAVNVCERVIELKGEIPYPIPPAIPRMGEIAREMLLDALAAFVARDTKKALDVCRRDEEVNVIHRELIRSIVTELAHDSERVSPAVRILFMSRALERFADHVTNVAEIIVYLVEGKVIRHIV